MKRTPRSQSGLGAVGVLIVIFALAVVTASALYVWQRKSQSDGVRLSGTIASDTCAPDYQQIPDVGCSIVVKGYTIQVESGFSGRPSRGSVTGLDANSLKARRADVYAQKDGSSKTLDISSSPKYYVHIH